MLEGRRRCGLECGHRGWNGTRREAKKVRWETHGWDYGLITARCDPARPLPPPQELHTVFALRQVFSGPALLERAPRAGGVMVGKEGVCLLVRPKKARQWVVAETGSYLSGR